MKSQINLRASALLQRQLNELTEQLGTSITETVSIAIDRMYQQETSIMQKTIYSVKVNGDILYHDLFKNEAISIAKDEAAQGNRVFVTWFRENDSQQGYLNSDGNHEIIGTAW